ncbi:MAG: hypothetical protein CMO36_06545 [Verrucomicrobiaceae bacterium]|jgi:hypothetical protein|nr:hypothetical protein [Verrucomicrobiales bacterium]MBN77854.1 hypothetical protein [Verrucomicrobiaceae bacterium]|tara:strand:- start:1847 stop:2131 length:285 start_codon:yes stop_codon:yes gene_type:complete
MTNALLNIKVSYMKIHDWKDRTDTGENRLWRATKHGGDWKFMSRLQKSEEGWTTHEKMEIEDLKLFREVLFNKYQRRRIPWEDVVAIDNMIEDS